MSMPTDGTGQRTPMPARSTGGVGQMSRPTSAPSGDTGQQSRPRDMGRDDQMDGQHRTYGTGAPGEQTGQTSHHRPGANVGQKTGAGGWDVPAVPADADIPRGTVIESGTLGKDKS